MAAPPASDAPLVAALRRAEEQAFAELVHRYSSSLLHLAQDMLGTRALAEEVVQETWLAVLQGIDRFEGRSSLKSWIYRILVNKAKTRAVREARTLPLSSFEADDESPVPEERFQGSDSRWAGHWATPPRPLSDLPEERLLSRELQGRLIDALGTLPGAQRIVVTLRDVVGFGADEVCDVLELSASNQRVLLHRGRSKLRAALEDYLEDEV